MVVLGRQRTNKTWDSSHPLFLHLVIQGFKGMERCDRVAILWYRELVELVEEVLCGYLVFEVVPFS